MKNLDVIGEAYNNLLNKVMESAVINEREKALVGLAIVNTLEDAEAVKNAAMTAKQLEISNEEIEYVNAMVALMKSQKIVSLDQTNNKKGGRCC